MRRTVEAVRFKADLPNYGVFDEKRVFAPGPAPGPVSFRGVRLGLPIEEVSVGDYVLTGGELPALILIDAVARLRRRLDEKGIPMAIAAAHAIITHSGNPCAST